MNASDIDAILASTLEDRTLTRTERQALFRSRAFELARASVTDPRAREVISWRARPVGPHGGTHAPQVRRSDDPRLVLPFCRAFDDLWAALG